MTEQKYKLLAKVREELKSYGSCPGGGADEECPFQDAHKSYFWDDVVSLISRQIDEITKEKAQSNLISNIITEILDLPRNPGDEDGYGQSVELEDVIKVLNKYKGKL